MFNALNWAWWPWVFRVASCSNAEKELQKGASFVLVLSALICAGVSLFADPIIRLIAVPSFWKAAQYVPVLSLAYWFFTATTPLSISARLTKRTDLFAVVNALAAGACLLFNFWLIPRYQVWGAIAATLASFILLVALVLYACQRIAPFKHNWYLITLSILGLGITAWWSNWIHALEPFDLLFRGMVIFNL